MLLALLGAAGVAQACGVCLEDQVASTYDHALVTRALAAHRVVVFAAVKGNATPDALAAEARRVAALVPGVERGSVRSATTAGATVSFVVDPAAATPFAAIERIEKASRTPKLELALLRVAQ
ncbi:MAG: hypothetical protein U1F48_05325 [Burkholderiales bacterium]